MLSALFGRPKPKVSPTGADRGPMRELARVTEQMREKLLKKEASASSKQVEVTDNSSFARNMSSAVWIDVDSKKSSVQLLDDIAVCTAHMENTVSLGHHHVQQHVAARCPRLIEDGRVMAGLVYVHTGTMKNSVEALDTVKDMVQIKTFRSIAEQLRSSTRRIAEQYPLPEAHRPSGSYFPSIRVVLSE